MLATQKVDEAVAGYREAIRLNPYLIEAWSGLSSAFRKLRQYEDSLAASNRILEIEKDNIYGWAGVGHALSELSRHEAALAAYDRAIALKPDFVEALMNRGSVCLRLRRYDDALAAFNRVIATEPNLANAWAGLGDIYYHLNRYEEALIAYDKALTLNDRLAAAWLGRGNVLLIFNRDDEARECLDKAICIQPDLAEAHFSGAILSLSLGDFEDGWQKYEWRWKMRDFPKRLEKLTAKNIWVGGGDIADKTVLIHAEQGLGDTLQFCRYLSALREFNCRTILAVQPPLVSFLSTQYTDLQVVSCQHPLPEFDLHCSLMSLPLAFKATPRSIPADIPYLSAPPSQRRRWQKMLGEKTKPKIGLAWSGSPLLVRNISRNIPLQLIAPILAQTAEWHSLQKDITDQDRAFLQTMTEPKLVDHSLSLTDFSETAALIENLDLVISVDTSVAHLAGALGKPVWILLPFHPDFRWLRNRTDSPWYPTARLFRQSRSGDWHGVVENLAAELTTEFPGYKIA